MSVPTGTPREVQYVSRDGLPLAAHEYGDRASPWMPVVGLPGLTRTSRDFDGLAQFLAGHRDRPRRVVAFDYRGRGRSAWDKIPANYNVLTETSDVLDGMVALGVSRAAVVGTSRGGIIGMLMAFSRPQTVTALVLNDIGPFIEPRGLVRLKSYVGRTPKPEDWADAARIQRRLHAGHFPAFDDADWDQFARMTYREEGGQPLSDYDPALAATLGEVDFDEPAPGLWEEFRALKAVPMLVIRGVNSDILSEATLQRMALEHPRLESLSIPDEGHPPILRGGPLLARIASFIATAEDGAPATIPTPAPEPAADVVD
jgi:pimeloyl-ACP methyl ester carboxylesterase